MVSIAIAAPVQLGHKAFTSLARHVNPGLGDVYISYTGDGTIGDGWPGQDSWVDFATMYAVLIAN